MSEYICMKGNVIVFGWMKEGADLRKVGIEIATLGGCCLCVKGAVIQMVGAYI